MKKITPSDLRRRTQAMIRDGLMPSLDVLLEAIAEVRAKYAKQAKSARHKEIKAEQCESTTRSCAFTGPSKH
jgi:hypothetical protein